MAGIVRYRNTWEKLLGKYERAAERILIDVFRAWGRAIPWDTMTEQTYFAILFFNTDRDLLDEAYKEIYTRIGKAHGQIIGKSINGQLKDFTLTTFLELFDRNIRAYLIQNLGQRITSVKRTYIGFINSIIQKGLQDGESLDQITAKIKKVADTPRFYRWQARRIARTESATAANYSASVASSVSGFVMQKVWISVLDSRTRQPPKSHFNHRAMNGQRVGQLEKFNVNGDLLAYPGDPNGRPANIINCRCTVAIVPQRINGHLVPTN